MVTMFSFDFESPTVIRPYVGFSPKMPVHLQSGFRVQGLGSRV